MSIMVEDLWNSGMKYAFDFIIADNVDEGWEEIPDKVKSKVGKWLIFSKNRKIVQLNLLQQMGNHINLHSPSLRRKNIQRTHINQLTHIHTKVEQPNQHPNINKIGNQLHTRNMINQYPVQIRVQLNLNCILDPINHSLPINLYLLLRMSIRKTLLFMRPYQYLLLNLLLFLIVQFK